METPTSSSTESSSPTESSSSSEPDYHDDAPDRLYRAVAGGRSVEEVRAAIQACAPSESSNSSSSIVAAAINRFHPYEEDYGDTLHAAHSLQRGDLVGLLLVHWVETATLHLHRRHDPLALYIAYGQAESLRELLRQDRHTYKLRGYHRRDCLEDAGSFCAPVHICIIPPAITRWRQSLPPQLKCLRVLVKKGGADINVRDHLGRTPPHWLPDAQVPPEKYGETLDLLMRFGADVNARGPYGKTLIFHEMYLTSLPLLLQLLDLGASIDVQDDFGATPLLCACYYSRSGEVVMELLRRSSLDTCRAIDSYDGRDPGWSALDHLVY